MRSLEPAQAFMRAVATVGGHDCGPAVQAEAARLLRESEVAALYAEASVVDPWEGRYPPGCTLVGPRSYLLTGDPFEWGQ